MKVEIEKKKPATKYTRRFRATIGITASQYLESDLAEYSKDGSLSDDITEWTDAELVEVIKGCYESDFLSPPTTLEDLITYLNGEWGLMSSPDAEISLDITWED